MYRGLKQRRFWRAYEEHKEGRAKNRSLGNCSVEDVGKRKTIVKDSEKGQPQKQDE